MNFFPIGGEFLDFTLLYICIKLQDFIQLS